MQETVELFPKPVKLMSSGSQNVQQIMQNDPLGASGDLLEASRFQDREKVSVPDDFGEPLGATWVILDAMLEPIGVLRGSTNRVVGHRFN